MTTVILAGCTSDSPEINIGSPKKGRSTSFRIGGNEKANKLAEVISYYNKFYLRGDENGNAYILGKTEYGKLMLVKFTRSGDLKIIVKSPILKDPHGFAVRPNGSIFISAGKNIYEASQNQGRLRKLSRSFKRSSNSQTSDRKLLQGNIKVLGVRPDGSVVVTSDRTVWALKEGRIKKIYTRDTKIGNFPHGAVDKQGNVYLMTPTEEESNLGDIEVIDLQGNARKWNITGSLPGTNVRASSLSPVSLAPSKSGGMYVTGKIHEKDSNSDEGDPGALYLYYISHGNVKVLARRPPGDHDDDCQVNKSYSALHTPCIIAQSAVEYKNMVLVMGGIPNTLGLAVQKP